jgi:hypothetical protein
MLLLGNCSYWIEPINLQALAGKIIACRDDPENFDSVAQLVEQYTFNVWVLGSSPSGITKPPQKGGFFFYKNLIFTLSLGYFNAKNLIGA